MHKLPQHIAIIMDGNGRWATQRNLPRENGHRAGMQRARRIAVYLAQKGIPYLTFFAFSTDNWKRPLSEVKLLRQLLDETVYTYENDFADNDLRFRHIGRLDNLAKSTQEKIRHLEETTSSRKGSLVSVAFDYGSRQEITNAAQELFSQGRNINDITEENLSKKLYTAGLPDVDLLIRTGGEQRLSNFLLWQCAYAEIYFTPIFWPDFDEVAMQNALDNFVHRDRRYGAV